MSQTNQTTALIPQSKAGELVLAGVALPVEVTNQLPHPIQNGYEWFDKTNERTFLELVEGLFIAWRHGLKEQIAHYQPRIVDLVHRDSAQRVAFLVQQELRYGNGKFWHTLDRSPCSNQTIWRGWLAEEEWTLYPLRQFSQFIPPQAMRALVFFETHEFDTSALWVAEKRERRDPVLCVSVGRYLIALAEWK